MVSLCKNKDKKQLKNINLFFKNVPTYKGDIFISVNKLYNTIFYIYNHLIVKYYQLFV